MKKIVILSFLLIVVYANAQDFVGFNQSNYAGVSGIYQQPASIVDSRMKFDMNLAAFTIGAYNNYIGLKREALKTDGKSDFMGLPYYPAFSDDKFAEKYLVERVNDKNKSLYLSNRIVGPSFMINLNRKNAFAISTCVRNYFNIDGVSPDLAKLAYEQFVYPSLWVTNLTNKRLSVQEMTWAEYGITYAHVFKEEDDHFFKAGATVKLLQGIQSAYIFVEDLQYNFKTDTTLSLFQSHVNYGHSDNLSVDNVNLTSGGNGGKVFDFSQSYPGFGFDIGAVYEYRPDHQTYKYNMDGEKNLWRKDQNKYKLKIGVSLTDLGSIKFRKGGISNDFNANVGYWNLKPVSPHTLGQLDDTIKTRFHGTSGPSTYKMNLPTALSFQIDYRIKNALYLNFTPYLAFQFKKNDTKVHDFSSLTLTPRWDNKWLGVFIPVQYNFLDGFRTGLALRLGPIIVGTTNLAPLIGKQVIYGADFYAMVKVPIPYGRIKDRDKDEISDKKDKCKTVPGVWEFMGCPDTDGDHIQDSEDKCPVVAGLKELQGCPDKDGDGITDLEDNCPDDKGLVEFKGCPDRDGDKIIDKEDKCPDNFGLAEFIGCPDKDGDKIIDDDDDCPDDFGLAEFLGCPDKDGDKTPDKYDLCPDLPGPKEHKGCPDKDGDTVLDQVDNCPDVAGAVDNKGCPWPDTDKDGVPDKDDLCLTVPGTAELKGCPPPPPPPPAPVLKVEEQKILEKAFESLEFATGKDIIKPSSFKSLNDLAALMKLHPTDWVLTLAGHTDNQGDAAKNMLLSQKRTTAVKKYLVSKGVKAPLIKTSWYGQLVPIADNATEEGRQKNRRVEMKVIFK